MKKLIFTVLSTFAATIIAAQTTQTLPYATAFEDSSEFASLWKIENTNAAGDNANGGFWIYSPDYFGVDYTGSVVYIPHPGGNVGDDWAFTPAFALNQGDQYVVSFDYATLFTGYPDKLSVHYGLLDTSSSMLNLIHDFGSYSNTNFSIFSDTFAVATSGVYYIGFHAYGPGGTYGGQTFDNFSIVAVNTGITITPESHIRIYPNPASDMLTFENTRFYQYSLYNTAGELVLHGLLNDFRVTLKLNLPAGLYFMQLTSPEGVQFSSRVGIN
jgi:hypothetical protein